MRTFQVVIDVNVSDDQLTENSIVSRWKKQQDLLPGVTISRATAVQIIEPDPVQGLGRSLADIPGASTRLVGACRKAGIYTVEQMADSLYEFNKFRNMGPKSFKEAIAICITHGAKVNPDEFEASPREFAKQLLAQRTALVVAE